LLHKKQVHRLENTQRKAYDLHMQQKAAVLTGDLINSTRAPAHAVDATMRLLADAANTIGDDTRFTRFRGDGWQIYLHNPGQCLWACLLILARLKASDTSLSTRISVGIGAISTLPEADLSAAAGPAFVTSGHGLDDMATAQILALGGGADPFQRSVFAFSADRASRWSREQAEAMALALDARMQNRAAIAAQLGITRQAVDARLVAAGYRLLDEASHAFLDTYTPATLEHPHD
jgi:hypothetical protein